MNTNRCIIIKSSNKWYDLKLDEIWEYRNLILLFVKRNYSTRYKQTILGPAWLLISPVFTVVSYAIVFGGIARLSTDGIPGPVFYFAGTILWGFFANCVSTASNTFISNAGIFGKIYFPRLISPIATVLTFAIDFCIQFMMMIVMMFGYHFFAGVNFAINKYVLLTPLILLELGIFGMSLGILISSLTTKYRDLTVLVGFGLNIWMYATPIIYSTTLVPEKLMNLFMLNPITPSILIFKYAFFGIGEIPYYSWVISWIVTFTFLLVGVVLFNKVERNFLDTI